MAIRPDRRDELKKQLVEAIETMDPSRAGRANEAAEGLLLVAELIPPVVEGIARIKEKGDDLRAVRFDLEAIKNAAKARDRHKLDEFSAHAERLVVASLDGFRLGPNRGSVPPFTDDEIEAMGLINDAIRRSRGQGQGKASGEGEGPEANRR